jgi:hypothetical protein
MSEEDDENRPEYDPTEPTPPSREPPRRSTAPQSAYTTSQVAMGWAIAVTGLVLTFAVPILLA